MLKDTNNNVIYVCFDTLKVIDSACWSRRMNVWLKIGMGKRYKTKVTSSQLYILPNNVR